MRWISILGLVAVLAGCGTTAASVAQAPATVTATPPPPPIEDVPTPRPSSTPSPRLSRMNNADPTTAEFVTIPTGETTLRAAGVFAYETERDTVVVAILVSNAGNQSASLYKQIQLQDRAGRRFDLEESPTDLLAYFRTTRWVEDFDIFSYTKTLQPGRAALVPSLFRVSPASEDLHLVPALR